MSKVSLQSLLEERGLLSKAQNILNSGKSEQEIKLDLAHLLQNVHLSDQETVPADETLNPLQILVLSLHYDTFKGKMAVGKISNGRIVKNMPLQAIGEKAIFKGRVSSLMVFDGLGLKEVEEAGTGEIVMVGGLEAVSIGDTVTTPEFGVPLPRVKVDEPTIRMTFGVNTSPFAGREGKMSTSRQIRERLMKELETNVALRVEDHPDSSEKFIVSGRGELHLSVLIESMRREGFELEVSRPEVIFKTKEEVEAI